MNRKQRRALNKMTKNNEAASSIDLMLGIATECSSCHKPYDKFSKEMANSWFIEVYKSDKKTILYCPECFSKR